jgi:UMF1 family MFS transporter
LPPVEPFRPTRLSVASWASYDLANTIFALGVGALYFPEWLTEHVDGLPGFLRGNGDPDLALAVAIDIAMVAVIVLGPWIGARSDHIGRRVRYLVPATMVAVIPTFFLGSATPTTSLFLFGIALVGFHLGSVIYDALLPDVSTPETIGRISGLGVAVGYFGSVIAWLIGKLLLDSYGYAVVFRSIAIAFLVFAIPAFTLVRERPRQRQPGPAPAISQGLRRVVAAWRRARTYPGVVRFLVGRFLYTDAINTLIGGFLTIYVIEEVGFTDDQVQDLLIVAIAGALVGGYVGGRIVDRIGPKRLLHGVLQLWMVAMLLGIVAGASASQPMAWPLGGLGGLALGATWAADRVYMQRISPPRHLGEFYGLYAVVGRFATILGPLIWGIQVTVFGWPRGIPLATLMLFLIAAVGVLRGVDDEARIWGPEDLAPHR